MSLHAVVNPPLCQVAGCRARVAQVVDVELPGAWEATAEYTTLRLVAGACRTHGRELARRAYAVLDARSDPHNLTMIVAAAVESDKGLRLQKVTEEADRLELEAGGLRERVLHMEGELRTATMEIAALRGNVAGYRAALVGGGS